MVEAPYHFPQRLRHFTLPPAVREGSGVFMFSPTLVISCRDACEVPSLCGLICVSLISVPLPCDGHSLLSRGGIRAGLCLTWVVRMPLPLASLGQKWSDAHLRSSKPSYHVNKPRLAHRRMRGMWPSYSRHPSQQPAGCQAWARGRDPPASPAELPRDRS